MDFWSNLQIHQWSSAGWILLYVISLILIAYNQKKWNVDGISIIIFLGISLFLFYSPIFANIMVGSFLPTYLEYSRISWLLFVNPVCAFAIVKIVRSLTLKQKRKAVVLLLIIGILFSNVELVIRDYTTAENYYKIPDDVVSISEALIDDSGCDNMGVKPTVLVQENEDNGLMGNTLYHGIRQYTSGPVLTKVVISPETYEAEGFQLIDYGLMNYEYFVCHSQAEILRVQAETAGFTLLNETDDFCLYKNNKVITVYFVRHGQTDANVQGIYAGSGTDAILTNEGILQVSRTGKALSGVRFSDVYTSEMTRAKDTANYLLAENEFAISEIQTNSYLNDFYWGEIEGKTLEEVSNLYQDFNYDSYIGTATDNSFVSPIGSWSKSNTISRYRMLFLQVAAYSSNNGNVLVVGHSAMVWYFQLVFPEQVSEVDEIDNASISVLRYDRGSWMLLSFNLSAEEYEEIEE